MSLITTLPEELAEEANLRYVSDSMPGIMRVFNGKNPSYYDHSGQKITDKKVLSRIDALGIPPAWEYVWICPLSFGHIQVTGRDEKGRKQYIYHSRWNEISSQTKFAKVLSFSEMLPTIRHKIKTDMNLNGLKQEKILATIVWLLDNTYIRVGNEEYALTNKHYGLTTLHSKHVQVSGENVVFEFTGKSGKKHQVGISHPRIAKTIHKLEELPGYELFQYIDEHGQRNPVDSSDVNEYLKSITQEAVSAKDFRTWGGTVVAASSLVTTGHFKNKQDLIHNVTAAVETTAKVLGNTPSVCRNYYIHPTVIQSYKQKILIPHFEYYSKASKTPGLDRKEYATSLLLKKYA